MVETPSITLEALKPGTEVSGTVNRLTLYGAMVNIGLEQDALLHISQLGKTDFRNVEDVFQQGQSLSAYVLKVDNKSNRVALTMVKPPSLPWDSIQRNTVYNGIITRIEKFGAFVDIGAERPGMVHVSEMADGYVQSPSDVVKVGQAVEVRVIKLNKKNRQIDLTMKTPKEEVAKASAPETAEDENLPTAMELALRRARAMSERSRVPASREREREPERRRPMRNDDDEDMMPSRPMRGR